MRVRTAPSGCRACTVPNVQEALAEIATHADAHAVQVRLERRPGSAVLVVQDDGRSFDPHTPDEIGLVGARERLRLLGGRLTFGDPAACLAAAISAPERPVPAQQRPRRDQKRLTRWPRQVASGRGEPRAIGRPELRPPKLAAQDLELVTEL